MRTTVALERATVTAITRTAVIRSSGKQSAADSMTFRDAGRAHAMFSLGHDVRDRGEASAAVKIQFSSSIVPGWARRTKESRWAVVGSPLARGVDPRFPEALAALQGKAASNLSPAASRHRKRHFATLC